MKDCSISIANALAILQSCTKSSMYSGKYEHKFVVFCLLPKVGFPVMVIFMLKRGKGNFLFISSH